MKTQSSLVKSKTKSSKNSVNKQVGQRRSKRADKLALPARPNHKQHLLFVSVESLCLLISASFLTMSALGYSASRFNGSGFFSHLLPFSIGVVALIVLAAMFLIMWGRLRVWLSSKLFMQLPALIAFCLALALSWYIFHDGYTVVFTHFRTLVGGKQQAETTTLAHQVYAAYRRYDEADLQKMIERSAAFNNDILAAANQFDLDPEILLGVAATESSFLPRESKDGGHGLFQITVVPKFLLEQAREKLSVEKLSLLDSRHNAFVAAATLKHYLAEMDDDLFLGLLAYNIGPKNGGLKFIMEQYGATDFATMQPYLQQFPRDYPIRVLSYSLAFRLWRQDGKLLAYQDGDNAVHIQRLGIPGLQTFF